MDWYVVLCAKPMLENIFVVVLPDMTKEDHNKGAII